jgi:hypothetical protein
MIRDNFILVESECHNHPPCVPSLSAINIFFNVMAVCLMTQQIFVQWASTKSVDTSTKEVYWLSGMSMSKVG